jgi:hypothetical protein
MESNILWDVMPYGPVEVNGRFGRAYCLRLQGGRVISSENQQERAFLFGLFIDPADGYITSFRNVSGLTGLYGVTSQEIIIFR